MDQLNRFFETTRRSWGKLSVRQQRLARLAILGCGLLLAVWGIYQAAPRYERILSGRTFSPRELTVVESALAQAGLDDYVIENRQVRVPREHRAEYIGALAAGNALPVQFDLELKDELSRSSPFESQEQRRARLQSTQQRELSLILRAMKGIEDATVQLDQSMTGPFQRERRMTAMVVVRPSANHPLDVATIRSIRHLVASSKVDLQPENVTVTDLETGICFAGGIDDRALMRSDEFAVRKMTYQRDWQQKLRTMLGHIPGVCVAVNVDLQYETRGSIPHVGGTSESATVLVPSRVGVAIGVPDSFYQTVLREQHRSFSHPEQTENAECSMEQIQQQQNERIRELIKQALPALATISIETIQSNTPGIAAAYGWESMDFMPIGWQTVGLGLLSLTLLVALCWNITRDSLAARRAEQESSADEQIEQPDSDVSPLTVTNEPMFETLPDERDDFHQELTRIVRQDPDAAAAKLAEWIEKAA